MLTCACPDVLYAFDLYSSCHVCFFKNQNHVNLLLPENAIHPHVPQKYFLLSQIALFSSSATSVNQLVTQFWKPSFQLLNVAKRFGILKTSFIMMMTMKIFWPDFENPQRPRWSSTPLLAKLLCWIHLHKINIRFSTNRKKTSSTRKTASKWNPCLQR